MNVLDWLLVLLVLAYALSGYWQGFVTGAFATTGLLLGGLLGIWLAPRVLGDSDPSLTVSLGALFVVIVAASLGQALLQFLGAKLRDPAHRITVLGPRGWRSPGFLIGDDHDVILWGFTGGVVARLFEFLGWIEDLPDAPEHELPAYMLGGTPPANTDVRPNTQFEERRSR